MCFIVTMLLLGRYNSVESEDGDDGGSRASEYDVTARRL